MAEQRHRALPNQREAVMDHRPYQRTTAAHLPSKRFAQRSTSSDVQGSEAMNKDKIAQSLSEIKRCAAYIDTVILFVHRASSIEGIPGAFSKPCESGYLVIAQQPTPDTLTMLAALQRRESAVLSRVDVAFDLHSDDVALIQRILQKNIILKWRRAGQRVTAGDDTQYTQYWIDTRTQHDDWIDTRPPRNPRPQRNVTIYSDRPSKVTSEPCCHLELRLRGQWLRNVEINLNNLSTQSPRDLFRRCLKLVDTNNFFQREQKRTRKLFRSQSKNPTTQLVLDTYRKRCMITLEKRVERCPDELLKRETALDAAKILRLPEAFTFRKPLRASVPSRVRARV
jgi:hypothetical protein